MINRKDAKQQGLKRYFSGQTCKHGHTDERLTSTGACVICSAKYSEKWKIDNREAKLASCKKYYSQNKELISKKQKSYRADQKERYLKVKNEYISANREKVNAYKSAWKKRNASKVAFDTVKRNAAKKQRTPIWLTDVDFERMENEYKLASLLTKLTSTPWHVDHIIPLQGKNVCGLHVPTNLRAILGAENIRKRNSYAV